MINRMGERYDLHEGEDYLVGTMIELPRACFIADRLAAEAAFFSFGTNDLTQTALGFSRDDVEAGFVPKEKNAASAASRSAMKHARGSSIIVPTR